MVAGSWCAMGIGGRRIDGGWKLVRDGNWRAGGRWWLVSGSSSSC